MSDKIIIGSRGSELALWQANFVQAELKKIGIHAEIKIIKTQGDKIQYLSFEKLEGKGFFTKEIEEALLKKEIDLAVHSHKDLPTESPTGLMIAAVSDREDPSELLLINKNAVDENEKFSLKRNASVGTSSARRKSQILAWRSDVKIEELRGNVPTRIQKLRDKKYDAILIANAGVSRLNIDLSEFHVEKLSPKEFIPAPAQGVLALQIRQSDKDLYAVLQKLNCKEVGEIIFVERKILNLFDGGCQLPLGVYCESENGIYKVRVAKAETWNSFPKYFYFEAKKTDGLAKKIVDRMNSVKPTEVFISRGEKRDDFFKRCLEVNGYKVLAQSLIAIKKIEQKSFLQTDWVFFSSKNAVKHFFEQKPNLNGAKLGAVSKATAEELRKFGKRADFIGGAGDTKLTGKKFSAQVGNKKVLFPQAKGSLRTIQQQLKKEQVIDLPVYETLKVETSKLKVESFDIFIFTSPSNVESFFEKNKIGVEQKVIAMGDATAQALKKFNLKVNAQPASFDDLGLVQAVMSL